MTRSGIVVGVVMAIMAGCDDEQGQPAASPTSTTSAPASTSSSTTSVASTTTTTSPPEDHPYGERYMGLIFTTGGDAVVVDGKPLPGLTISAEAAVYDPGHNAYDQPYPHGLTHVRDPNQEMVWFDQTVGDRSPNGGAPPNKVIDVLVVPTHLSDERIWFGDCGGHPSVPAIEIVALVRVTDTPSWTAIKAWRANRQAAEFEPMPTEGIECENVGYGA